MIELNHCKQISKKFFIKSNYILAAVLIGFFLPFTQKTIFASYPSSNNAYSRLHVPTQITKIENTYYIVDCYHDQIIYSNVLNLPLNQWKIMTNNVHQPHAIASDGTVYLVVDTENNRVISYEKKTDRFKELQIFEQIGIRPHYILYEPSEKLFYVWSSLTGEMYLFKRTDETTALSLIEVRSIPLLNERYVRSFTLTEDSILFPCVELGAILQVDRNTFEIKQYYPVPDNIAGIVQIVPIENYFYISVSSDKNYDQSQAAIIRTSDLSQLANNSYENLNSLFKSNGVPYYISYFEGNYFMIHENASPSIYRFQIEDTAIKNISGLF